MTCILGIIILSEFCIMCTATHNISTHQWRINIIIMDNNYSIINGYILLEKNHYIYSQIIEISNMSKKLNNNKITGEAAENLIWCFSCRASKETRNYEYTNQIPNFPWVVFINFPNPQHSSWIVCSKCNLSKKQLEKKIQLIRHHRRFHQHKTVIKCNKRKEIVSSKLDRDRETQRTNIDVIKNTASKEAAFPKEARLTSREIIISKNTCAVKKMKSYKEITFGFGNEKKQ